MYKLFMTPLPVLCERASEYGAQVYEVVLDAASPSADANDIRTSAAKLHAIGQRLTMIADQMHTHGQRLAEEERLYG